MMGSLIFDPSASVGSTRNGEVRIAQSTPSPSFRSPTEQAYREFHDAYTYFNRALFNVALPDCLITMQRHSRSLGFYCHGRFVNSRERTTHTDEIALNPSYFASRTESGVMSTLVHEMAHLFQFHFGTRPRGGYHNRQWADRMIAIGLYPSDTGAPGGRETGYHMTHYIVENGPFDVACQQLLESGFRLSWVEDGDLWGRRAPVTTGARPGRTDGSNRWKYTCPICGFNAWAKPDGQLACAACSPSPVVLMVPRKHG